MEHPIMSGSGPPIFISYSHQDEIWKDKLDRQLRVLELEGAFVLWDDRKIAAGDNWRAEIETAIENARAAVLLISADFLISDFIRGMEVPRLLQRRAQDGLRIIPLIVRPCAWQGVEWLSEIECRPKGGRALSEGRKAKAEKDLAALALEIRNLLREPSPLSQGTAASLDSTTPVNRSVLPSRKGGGWQRALSRRGTLAIICILLIAALVILGLKVRAADAQEEGWRMLESEVLLPASRPRSETEQLYVEGLEQLARFDLVEAQETFERIGDELVLAHSALAVVWMRRSEMDKAGSEATKAFERRNGLPWEQRLFVEASYHRIFSEWDEASRGFAELYRRYPKNIGFGLALIEMQTNAGKEKEALSTLARLRKELGDRFVEDPRLDLAEAFTKQRMGDNPGTLAAAERAIEKAQRLDRPLAEAKARIFRGISKFYQGKFSEALADFEKADELYSYSYDQTGMLEALNAKSLVHKAQGKLQEAKGCFEEARWIYHRSGDLRAEAGQVSTLAEIASEGPNLADAHRLFVEALEMQDPIEDRDGRIVTLSSFTLLLLHELKLDQAERRLDEAQKLASDPIELAVILYGRGQLLTFRGRLDDARESYERALQTRIQTGQPEEIARLHLALTALFLEEARPLLAESTVKVALKEPQAIGPDLEAEGRALLAQALIAMDRREEARKAIGRARALADHSESVRLRLEIDLADARFRIADGDPAAALGLIQAAHERAGQTGHAALELEARLVEGEVEWKYGDPARGRQLLAETEQEARRRGYLLVANRARKLLAAPVPS